MYDSSLRDALARARNRQRQARAAESAEWLVYGAGRMGRLWANELVRSGRTVHGFIDRMATAGDGLVVYRPAECPADLKRRSAVLLAVHNPGVDVGALRGQLIEQGYGAVWLLQDLIDQWPQCAHFWLGPSGETLGFETELAAAHALLADEQSRRLFAALVDQRLNGITDGLPVPDGANHYMPADLPMPELPMRFIDCGAYTGDTVESLRAHGVRFSTIAAFEPDASLYSLLCKAVTGESASAFPCGVWDETTQLRFSPDDSAGHITADGEVVIQTVSLDQALPNFAPTFIKMDIEGAEDRALRGAARLIARYRPRLAISVYHRPADLWRLQSMIDGWDCGYRFYLRSHAYNGFETVLYALPKS